MESNLFPIIMSLAAGTFTLFAAVLNWNFFFEDRKAKFFVNLVGRKGARIFYGLLGLALYWLAYKMISG